MNKNYGLHALSTDKDGYADPPKNKLDKLNEAIINGQPNDSNNNNYEEPVTDNTPKKNESEKQPESTTKKNFEYKNDGEFDNGSQVTETDSSPDGEYL